MPRFEIGEVIEGVGFVSSTQCNGMEGTIIGGLQIYTVAWARPPSGRTPITPFDKLGYRVAWSNGTTGIVYERNLRKRNPPMGDWESLESNIGWERPVEVIS